MRYVPPPSAAVFTQRARKYLDHMVRTTDDRMGIVETATVRKGVVVMVVRDLVSGETFDTDNEHATIVRDE